MQTAGVADEEIATFRKELPATPIPVAPNVSSAKP
jgi:hypothetical protein